MAYQGGAHAIGTVDAIAYTRGGYQITTIDGVRYGTLFDYRELPGLQPGCKVSFVVKGIAEEYGVPYAHILRVLAQPQPKVPHKRSRRRKM